MLLNNSCKISGTKKLANEGVEVIDVDECAIIRDHPKQDLRDWSSYEFGTQGKGGGRGGWGTICLLPFVDLDVEAWEHSHKIRVILAISELCRDRNEKLIIVSHSIVSLSKFGRRIGKGMAVDLTSVW